MKITLNAREILINLITDEVPFTFKIEQEELNFIRIKMIKFLSLAFIILLSTNLFSFSLNNCLSFEKKSCCCKSQISDSKSMETEKFMKNCGKSFRGCSDFKIEAKVESFILPEKQVSTSLIPEIAVIQKQSILINNSIPDIRRQKLAPDKYIEHCNLRI